MNNGEVKIGEWLKFEGELVDKFDEHVKASIPNYEVCMEMMGFISTHFIQNGSFVLDLGCSTAAGTRSVLSRNKGKNFEVHAIDVSDEMLTKAQSLLHSKKVKLRQMDLSTPKTFDELPKSDLIISSLFIQFLNRNIRPEIIKAIYNRLTDDGAFLWFEKSMGESSKTQTIYKNYMNNYKLNCGLTPESILNKDDSLRGIMPIRSLKKNIQMLEDAGFSEISIVHKQVNFTLFIAIK